MLGAFAAVAAGSFKFDGTIHIIDEYPPKDRIIEMVYGLDWGWTNPACIVAIGLDGDNRAYILEEFYQNRISTATIIREIKNMQKRWGEGTIVCDRSEPKSINDLIDKGLDAIADASKREDGIRELGSRFEDPGDGNPRIYVHKDCVNWISEVQTYDQNKKQQDHAMDATRYALTNQIQSNVEISFGRRDRY